MTLSLSCLTLFTSFQYTMNKIGTYYQGLEAPSTTLTLFPASLLYMHLNPPKNSSMPDFLSFSKSAGLCHRFHAFALNVSLASNCHVRLSTFWSSFTNISFYEDFSDVCHTLLFSPMVMYTRTYHIVLSLLKCFPLAHGQCGVGVSWFRVGP